MFQVDDAACPAAATLAAAHDQRRGDREVAPAEPTGSRARAWPMICPRAARLANQPPKGLYVNTADSWESAAFFSIGISWATGYATGCAPPATERLGPLRRWCQRTKPRL